MMETNHFVCTLDEAVHAPGGRPFSNVCDLIDKQAENIPDSPAIGFFKPSTSSNRNGPLQHNVFTFRELRQKVKVAAQLIHQTVHLKPGESIGLLCSSSADFLIIWLACVWTGNPVLLIAPECSPSGIAYLCKSCSVSTLLTDSRHEDLGIEAVKDRHNGSKSKLRCIKHPFVERDVFKPERDALDLPPHQPKDSDTAYFHHTSGTSSGTPKPIPQSHASVVGSLPAIPEKGNNATFTTTPLFHGGPADVFRAWSSSALIWLFPASELPITSGNVVRCFEAARGSGYPVTRFASVPYVLERMADEADALRWLKDMNLVGVGGAALPKHIGDQLVEDGVRLVSRFGSAECGFLLSSHRDYDNDKEWQYLRLPSCSSNLKFELHKEKELSELVVLSRWAHMAKSNREDSSYATSDLFEPHEHLINAWRYHSKADSGFKLMTGLQVDAGAMETTIAASSNSISDIFVFGDQRPYPGALLFRSEAGKLLPNDEIKNDVESEVARMNAQSPSHAQLSSSMLIPVLYEDGDVPKSSKGTILRKQAEERYRDYIESAYSSQLVANGNVTDRGDDELTDVIRDMVVQSLPSGSAKIDIDTDLFAVGVDSMASIQIRRRLQQLLPENDSTKLSMSVVEDCGSIRSLADRMLKLRHGESIDNSTESNDHDEMERLIQEYSSFDGTEVDARIDSPAAPCTQIGLRKDVIILTGATGALGAHVLHQLIDNENVSKIYCLVRGSDKIAATERVKKALNYRHKFPSAEMWNQKVSILTCRLGDHDLGLSWHMYETLLADATCVLHLAWSVNFNRKLQSFARDSIASVTNLGRLAIKTKSQSVVFAFSSSTASVAGYRDDKASGISEAIIQDRGAAGSIGYSQSKYVAEHVCSNLAKNKKVDVSIFRVGQLSGDTQHGIWNSKEAWPAMLSTVDIVGCLPDLGELEVADWLPVDVAATAMIQGALGSDKKTAEQADDAQVYHIVNDKTSPTWRELLQWLGQKRQFDVVSPEIWLKRLELALQAEANHPAYGLIDHWRSAYLTQDDNKGSKAYFIVAGSKAAMPILQDVQPVDEAYFDKLWAWLEGELSTWNQSK